MATDSDALAGTMGDSLAGSERNARSGSAPTSKTTAASSSSKVDSNNRSHSINRTAGGNSATNGDLRSSLLGFFNTFRIDELWKNSSTVLVLLVMVGLMMILVPLPAPLLDFFMIVNIIIAITIIITVINTKNPLEFSTFPTVLLFATGFRLAVNISSTRLILSQGINFNGQVVQAFANFVTGGSYWIGVVIFIIIITVQFFVITRGANRSSEVIARFKLDALPGKQIAIDSDLNAGLINEQQAIERRKNIQREADFYGSMDGAGKFISGEVLASIIIIFINIIGGIFIGIVVKGEGFQLASESYVKFAIGDGLVAAVPSLITAITSGIIVTRNVEEDNIAEDLSAQLFNSSRTFYIIGLFVLFLGFLPGFPKVISFVLTASAFYIGYVLSKARPPTQTATSEPTEEAAKRTDRDDFSPERIVEGIQVDPIEIELGYELIVMADESKGGDLLDRVRKCRKQLALELGLVIPHVRITDNLQLKGTEYQIKINGSVIGSALLMVGKLLAIDSTGGTLTLEFPQIKDPVFGLPAYWIDEKHRAMADKKGFTIVDPPTIISTHLSELMKLSTDDILGRKETQSILDIVKKNNPPLVKEMEGLSLKISHFQKLLKGLLEERVSIRNVNTILEVLCDNATGDHFHYFDVLERVRQALGRQISATYSDDAKNINAVVLSRKIENDLIEKVKETGGVRFINIDPANLRTLLEAIAKKIAHLKEKGYQPLIVTDSFIRKPLREVCKKSFQDLVVISSEEIASGYYLNILDEI
ncbi:flagellar biosynthesis protein FlhA [Spirochaetota bacterium]|nr:flagellar biosynthesis protein FlhA [Spirochaetota bacterium]